MNMMAKTHEVPVVPVQTKERLVVVGNGMAGIRAVEELLQRDPDRYDITIFGAEPQVNYNRIMLSPVLAGEKTFDEIVINDRAWYADNGITLLAGETVVDDRPRRPHGDLAVAAARVDYDRLLLATGSDPFIIPVPGRDLPGVVDLPRHRRRRSDAGRRPPTAASTPSSSAAACWASRRPTAWRAAAWP